ncbi:serine hydrolase domain-containing protein [Actinomadura sp. DC4]|uniref:serine hydrolase domain-containing protein n=1 Tax=Actinomadura sp. DC4 TaxID=3055069 RepID=UPI0025AEEC14|nr:serine hydrolase domain-containing protein [Actinomadura sp. DC4]MDN3354087.1 serine hydrolase domain-containing protein [Actinomadura sp. DC4]
MSPEEILTRARRDRTFSGAAWAYGGSAGVAASGTVGTLSWGGDPVGEDTLWDLASLTKPIAGLAVMALVESGELTLDETVAAHLPEYAGTDKASITVFELLTHTSGLPGQETLWRRHGTRDELLAALVRVPLRFAPGAAVEYNSLGFVVLGMIAERVAGVSLATLVAERVTGPAGMARTRFLLPEADRRRAAATEDCPWRGRIVQGTVHDETAEVLGDAAAHAGLFGSLDDLAALGETLCRGGAGRQGRVLGERTLAVMTEPRTGHLALRRSLAWQGRDPHHSSSGDLMSPAAYGHTGFTGTSIWVDPLLDVFVVLLTNRVHPRRDSDAITRLRPRFGNAAVTACLAER